MATLRISMSTKSQVRIEPVDEISESVWEAVVDWWSYGVRFEVQPRHLEIDLSEFFQRKIWLRENWINAGNNLNIEEDNYKQQSQSVANIHEE